MGNQVSSSSLTCSFPPNPSSRSDQVVVRRGESVARSGRGRTVSALSMFTRKDPCNLLPQFYLLTSDSTFYFFYFWLTMSRIYLHLFISLCGSIDVIVMVSTYWCCSYICQTADVVICAKCVMGLAIEWICTKGWNLTVKALSFGAICIVQFNSSRDQQLMNDVRNETSFLAAPNFDNVVNVRKP